MFPSGGNPIEVMGEVKRAVFNIFPGTGTTTQLHIANIKGLTGSQMAREHLSKY